jgi:hypothetical protein
MTAGQRATAVAIIYPDPKRGVHSESRGVTGDVNRQRLSLARAVLAYSRETARER